MEEADEFIKDACKHLECSFSNDDEIDFSTPQIFEFLVRCIWKIDSSSKAVIPSYHVKNIAGRLHLGNKISEYLQKFQIRGDIALSTVLYGNITNLRSAFIELIRKLPADTQETVDEDRSHVFFDKTLNILESEPQWVPVYCRSLQKTKHNWVPPDNSPESFLLSMPHSSIPHDPRTWISQYVNLKSSELLPRQFSVAKNAKPALPPKPVFPKKKEQLEQGKEEENALQQKDEKNEKALLEAQYEEKLQEYRNMEDHRKEIEKKSEELRVKLSEYDPQLMEALQNPEHYAEHFSRKIAELNQQMENDVVEMEQRKEERAKREQEMTKEMRAMEIRNEEIKKIRDMEASLEHMDAKIEANVVLAGKLEKKLAAANEDNFYEFEKRSRELDEMVRKQENDMLKMQEERMVLRKQEERENEAVNRSFAIIYNILLQHCDHYRGRLAMESFTRIHLYCMEIMEMLRENGTLKQVVACLQSEISAEEQKQYDKQLELLKRDYNEIAELNEELHLQINAKDPSYTLPKL